jgi:sarcosine oxidase gamma subunit
LKVEYAPLFKLSVCFAEPLASDLVLDGLVSLPAAQGPQKRQDLYALAVNRYNKVVLSEDEAKLDDASSAITSAGLSGVYAAELLSRAVDVDPASIVDGGYVRCQFDHAVIVIHRVNDTFLLHWPEPLTAYLVQWIETVVGLDRD